MISRNRFSAVTGTGPAFTGLKYVPGSTPVHRLHPAVKLWLLLLFSLSVFTFHGPVPGLVLASILITFYRSAGLNFSFFLRKLRFFLVFGVLILVVQVLAVREGMLLLVFGPGWARIAVWSEGLFSGMTMMLRFLNVVGSSFLFITVTDPNRLAYALMQLGLPYRPGFMLVTALRFIPVFHLELEQVRNAQMAKGIELEKLSPFKLVVAVRYLLAPLVISALGRVDALAVSMESRAFGLYSGRTYLERHELSARDCLPAAVALGLYLILLLYSRRPA
jgi:energy-coupling factor transport system permease protein